jgi:hypothetical protein
MNNLILEQSRLSDILKIDNLSSYDAVIVHHLLIDCEFNMAALPHIHAMQTEKIDE